MFLAIIYYKITLSGLSMFRDSAVSRSGFGLPRLTPHRWRTLRHSSLPFNRRPTDRGFIARQANYSINTSLIKKNSLWLLQGIEMNGDAQLSGN